MGHVENMSKIFFFPSAVFLSGVFPKLIALFVCILALVRNYGRPQFNIESLKQYGQKVFLSEFFTNLIYLMSIAMARESLLLYLPLGIHFISGVAEYMIASGHGAY